MFDCKFYIGNLIYKHKRLTIICLAVFLLGLLAGLLFGAKLAAERWLLCFIVDWLIVCFLSKLFANVLGTLFLFFVLTLGVLLLISIYKAASPLFFVVTFILGLLLAVTIHALFLVLGGLSALLLSVFVLVIFLFILGVSIFAIAEAQNRWDCGDGYYRTFAGMFPLIKVHIILISCSLAVSFILSVVFVFLFGFLI